MKKVAFVAPTYPVLSETFIQTEVDSLKACGHGVCVMTFKVEQSEKSFDYDIVKIGKDVRMGKVASINWFGFIKALSFVSKQNSMPKKSLFTYGLKLALQLAERDIDHVHAHFCQHTAAHAIVAAKLHTRLSLPNCSTSLARLSPTDTMSTSSPTTSNKRSLRVTSWSPFVKTCSTTSIAWLKGM